MGKGIGGYVLSTRHIMNSVASRTTAAAAKPLNLLNFTPSSKIGNAFPLKSFKCTSISSRRPVWSSKADTKQSRYYYLLGIGIGINATSRSRLLPPPRAGDTDGYGFIHSSLDLPELELDPATEKLAIGVIGPFLSTFSFLFIIRIVMSWYPKLPVEEFPYVIAYAPIEPLLIPTRKLIPPLGGVDVTHVVWFGLLSFLNETLLGPQGLLVYISQQV